MTRPVGRRDQLIEGQLALTDAIYGAVLEPARWADLMVVMNRVFGGRPALIHRTGVPRRTRGFLASGLDPAVERSYCEYYAGLNPWELSTQGARTPLLANDGDLPAEAIDRSEFYAGWLRPQEDLRYTVNICAQIGPDETVELVDTRSRGSGPFDKDECALMLSLIPHLQRAVRLSNLFDIAEATRTATTKAFGRLGTGLLLVDAFSRILFMDVEADRILARGGGLQVRARRLVGAGPAGGRLSEAIACAAGRGKAMAGRSGAQMTVPRGVDRLPLSVSVSPLDERDRPPGLVVPLAMVVVSDPERQGGPDEEALRALLGLTPAEARLVAGLCGGLTLTGYAQANGTSLNTAKTHLKRVFDKTGETRQADLVRRVTGDVALRLTR